MIPRFLILGFGLLVLLAETSHAEESTPVSFERDVQPILTKLGCNAGACHGKARGQNGFQLSLLGFDSDFDYNAIVKEARGRRIFPASPRHSLLLSKPAAQLPHGGGKRLVPGDGRYEVLLRWIEQGYPRGRDDEPRVTRLDLSPTEVVLEPETTHPLRVLAHYTDGTSRDVTDLTDFQSNENVIAAVSDEGLIRAGPLPGEAAIMARFSQMFAVCHVLIPQPGKVSAEVYAQLPRHNFIDEHVWSQLQRLGITPSLPADDATFLRRVHLDLIGRLPTPDEVRAFLDDKAPDRRAKLVDALLARPEYADFWANKWADLLRPNPYRAGIKAVFNLDGWLRRSFRENKPYDEFVRELVTAKGSTFHNGATVMFRDRQSAIEVSTMVSQLFLGVRLECAKCHHHPFEIWGQDDFYSFAAYFAKVGHKGTRLSPPISGGEEIIYFSERGDVKHPSTGAVMSPSPLFGEAPIAEGQDPREALADWMLADDNPYFAKVIVNRVWADLMGRGIVDPVDDLRATNPPTNPALLEALAENFRKQNYDLKKLLRTIALSYVYGLESKPNARNVADTRNYSRHYRQRLRGEVLLDAICDITEVPETFGAMPNRTRAMQMWTVRSPSIFLDSFGRPDPNQDPPCERMSETTVVQTLHLMNAPKLHAKVIGDKGRAARLAASKMSNEKIVEELYLLVYARYPSEEEKQIGQRVFAREGTSRREATEDLLWALLNTAEFVFEN